jgi:hypothetical protein
LSLLSLGLWAGGCGNSVDFNGKTDHIAYPHTPSLDEARSFALRATVVWSGEGADKQNLVARRAQGRRDHFLLRIRKDQGGRLELGIGDGRLECGVLLSEPLPADQTLTVEGGFFADSHRLWVRHGAHTASITCPGLAATGDLPLWIGGDPVFGPEGRPFSGQIVSVEVWNGPEMRGAPAFAHPAN